MGTQEIQDLLKMTISNDRNASSGISSCFTIFIKIYKLCKEVNDDQLKESKTRFSKHNLFMTAAFYCRHLDRFMYYGLSYIFKHSQ